MKKEDFHVGQTVYVFDSYNYSNKSVDERITKGTVSCVGRKYITVVAPHEIKFDISNDFKEASVYTSYRKLYLSREDIDKYIERQRKERELRIAFNWDSRIPTRMTDGELETIMSIVRKYKII